MRTGQMNTVRKVISRQINAGSTSNEKEKSRSPLHFKMFHLMFTLAALPATIGAVATNMSPSTQTNAMALLNTARLIREQRQESETSLGIRNDDVRLLQLRVERVQNFSRGSSGRGLSDGEYGTRLANQLPHMLETHSVPSLVKRAVVQPSIPKKIDVNQFIPSDDLIWGEALFDDNAADMPKAIHSYSSIGNRRNIHETVIRQNVSSDTKVDNTDELKRGVKHNGSEHETSKKANSKKKSSDSGMQKIRTRNISTIMSAKNALRANKAANEEDIDDVDEQSSSTSRVSHEEELKLAHIIQKGVEINRVKSKFEKAKNREITRQEWTDLAKLDSPKELRRLVSNYRQAKNKLVMANMGLVHGVVRARLNVNGPSRNINTSGGISYEELVQEGSLGLLRAAELFDPSKGLRFSTYATIWIKGILGNSSLGEAITLPLREKNKWNKIQKAVKELSIENNEKTDGNRGLKCRPSHEDIASRGGMRPDEVKKVMSKMKRARNVLSLDYQYDSHSRSGTESQNYQAAFSNDKNLMDDVDLVEKVQLRVDVVAALSRNLNPREAHLMRLRYGLKDGKTRTIEECAKTMGISRARVQQLAAGCLKKLREAEDVESLQEYLLSVA